MKQGFVSVLKQKEGYILIEINILLFAEKKYDVARALCGPSQTFTSQACKHEGG